MFIPPQGFRHATTLLITQSCRAIAPGSPPPVVTAALVALARDLAALADDMRAAPDCAEWLIAEYLRSLEHVPHAFDRAMVQTTAREILSGVASRQPTVDARDLFLVFAPEDRLPVAAPLAVELAKRRVSVALAEVQTGEQLPGTLERGLEAHRAGAILQTTGFIRMAPGFTLQESNRLRIVLDWNAARCAANLTHWLRHIHPVKTTGI